MNTRHTAVLLPSSVRLQPPLCLPRMSTTWVHLQCFTFVSCFRLIRTFLGTFEMHSQSAHTEQTEDGAGGVPLAQCLYG